MFRRAVESACVTFVEKNGNVVEEKKYVDTRKKLSGIDRDRKVDSFLFGKRKRIVIQEAFQNKKKAAWSIMLVQESDCMLL